MKYFGSSGIRDEFPRAISPALAMKVGRAVASSIPQGRFIVGRDGRTTSQILSMSLSSALLESGAQVWDAGLVSTPTLAFNSRHYDAGVMITASHNPPQYNGVKLWNPDGSSFGTKQMLKVEELMDKGLKVKGIDFRSINKSEILHDAIKLHSGFILDNIEPLKRMSVVVDCGNGAGATITPRLLKDLGSKVIGLNTHVDGRFPGRDPEPTAKEIGSLRECVKASGSKLGIAHDGDADRMVAVDASGEPVSSDRLIALFAKEMNARTVVVPVDCSMCVEHYLKAAKVVRTRVGDVFISEEMKRRKADFGGEPSGTFVFPNVSYAPEGIFAAAYLCSIVSSSGPLSDIIDEIPRYPIRRKGIPFRGDRDKVRKAIEKNARATSCTKVDETDGYRMEFDDGWALVRLSGTEPKVRIMVEGIDERAADRLLAMGEMLVSGSIKGVRA